jgi:hypothetical protein
MLGPDLHRSTAAPRNGEMGMTWAGRRVTVVCAVIAVASSVSACRVLERGAQAVNGSPTAAADTLDMPVVDGGGSCPFTAAEVSGALGGTWSMSSLSSGGCSYAQGARRILASEVPLPRDADGRHSALAQTRRPCDPGSEQPVPNAPEAFVCQQGTLVQAVTVSGGHLVVVYTAAGPDPAQVPGIQTMLSTLLARVA